MSARNELPTPINDKKTHGKLWRIQYLEGGPRDLPHRLPRTEQNSLALIANRAEAVLLMTHIVQFTRTDATGAVDSSRQGRHAHGARR